MAKDYKELFHEFRAQQPEQLLKKILIKIRIIEIRNARIKLVFSSLITIVAAVSTIPAISYLTRAVYQSGTWEYFKLMFSDSQIIFTYWQEFGLSLLESFPFTELAIVLTAICIALTAVKFAVRQIKNSFTPIRLA